MAEPVRYDPLTEEEMDNMGRGNENLHTDQQLCDIKSIDEIFLESQDLWTKYNAIQEIPKEQFRDEDPYWNDNREETKARIVQSSALPQEKGLYSSSGLSSSIMDAYNNHYDLILRPDDFWQATLTQFSFYFNAHVSELQSRLIASSSDTPETLTVQTEETPETAQFSEFIGEMVEQHLAKQLVDPSLVDWVLPNFTTTTPKDRTAAAITLMSVAKQLFHYAIEFCCGIPNVTLQGTPEDWGILRAKFDRLLEFEIEGETYMERWHKMLCLIGDNLIASANGSPDIVFWARSCKHMDDMSGYPTAAGWVTTFSVFSEKGKWQANRFTYTEQVPIEKDKTDQPAVQERESDEEDWSVEFVTINSDFPVIDTSEFASGLCSAPITLIFGDQSKECTLWAGHVARSVLGEGLGTVQPRVDWCIAESTTS